MKKFKFLPVIFGLSLSILISCNMELQNPNTLTLHLASDNSATRGVLSGQKVITDLIDAQAVIVKIQNYNSEPKIYKAPQLQIHNNSIVIPNVKSGQGTNIELQIMNKYCTYIARAHNIEIEPYVSQAIILTMEEVRPHIMTWGHPVDTVYAIPNPDDTSLCFKSSINTVGVKIKWVFDKFGRFAYLFNSDLQFENYSLSTHLQSGEVYCIDTDQNVLYSAEPPLATDYYVQKRSIEWGAIKDPNQGAEVGNATLEIMPQSIDVGKNYLAVLTVGKKSGEANPCNLYCFNKHNINTIEKTKTLFQIPDGETRKLFVHVVENRAFVLSTKPLSTVALGSSISEMKVYSLPDLNLLKTVTGFTQAVGFAGKRNGKLYIADKGNLDDGIPPSLAIYDTLTGELKFINVKQFNANIDFNW